MDFGCLNSMTNMLSLSYMGTTRVVPQATTRAAPQAKANDLEELVADRALAQLSGSLATHLTDLMALWTLGV